MGSPQIPNYEIPWVGFHFVPLAAMILEPLHALVCKAIPLFGPCGDSFLRSTDSIVEFLALVVTTLSNDQATVIGPVGKQVHEALKTAKTGNVGILILMGPRLVLRQVLAIGKAIVDGIEGHDQVLCCECLFECADDSWL